MVPAGGPYRLESPQSAQDALRALAKDWPAAPPRRFTVRLELLDTFDGRVRRRGGRLALVRDDSATMLEWEPRPGERSYRCPLPASPAFVWELPEGEFRRELAAVVDVRRLLPVATVRLDCRELAILDRRRKTVARVRVEAGSAADPARPKRRKRIDTLLRVVPLRGYERQRREVVDWIEERLALPAAEPDTPARVQQVLGIAPPSGGKRGYPIERGMRCDEAMKAILLTLLEAMRRNEAGTRADLDSEFLHDFRVAVRRTRSALGQVPAVFAQRTTDRFKRGFAWLGAVTSPVRDWDVQILNVILRPRPATGGAGEAELLSWLRGQQRVAQRRLVRALDSARYRRLVDSWRAFLESPGAARSGLANATRPIEQVAAERIRRAHRRVMKKGGAIDDDSPPQALHRLRIDCKKLRYLLEFFAGLYPRDEVRPLIDALKQLQNNLGDYNDLAVEQDFLARYLGRLADDDSAAAAAGREEAAARIAGLHRRQNETRAAFGKRFEAFSRPEVQARFRRLDGEEAP
jgi:CHAD domain-containing protein